MQEIKVTDTYKCPLCGEKLIEVRLGVTNATYGVCKPLFNGKWRNADMYIFRKKVFY